MKASYKSNCLKGAFLGVEVVTIVVLFSDAVITDTGCGASVCVRIQSFWSPSNPMEDSPPGSSIHGILWSRILRWIAISSSKGQSQPRDQTHVQTSPVSTALVGGFPTWSHLGSPNLTSALGWWCFSG